MITVGRVPIAPDLACLVPERALPFASLVHRLVSLVRAHVRLTVSSACVLVCAFLGRVPNRVSTAPAPRRRVWSNRKRRQFLEKEEHFLAPRSDRGRIVQAREKV